MKIFALSLLLVSCSLADVDSATHDRTSSPGGRYEIVQSPLAAKWTFRLGRFTGRIWQLVDARDARTWQLTPVETLLVIEAKAARFQIFTSGIAARHIFLIDTYGGATWELAGGQDEDHPPVWQRFKN